MTLEELWSKIISYPDRLVYFDRGMCEEDHIDETTAMNDFVNENCYKRVLTFEVDFSCRALFVDFCDGGEENDGEEIL